ncbi:LacI family DNA-binding transcriptional regulator [Aureimonas leprariae]|uniref:LacI family transcriptional regulator n=1 Tax=Plantimonas leprariae TaxID=2615207 RepID=A0A7V7PRI4_9HYPH|nr:LacI family DNA-binding transcriptional regulator [Aureimonas leprariae]KAB0681358.1 LacI family transcriptional regulator [Aureimonas leprariae]
MPAPARAERPGRPRQTDIARLSGVSVSTVSRALAGEPGISAGARSAVAKAAAELGYPLPPGFAGGDGATLEGLAFDVLLPAERATGDLGPFYQDILDGLRAAADACRFRVAVRLLADDVLRARDLERCGVDGVFVVGLDLDEAAMPGYADARPLVLVNGADPSLALDCVSPANFYGGRLGARTLLDLGHRRIAYVAGQHRHTTRERARGFRHAVAELADAAGFEGVLTFSGRTFEEAAAKTRELLLHQPDITAVFCMNDAIALGVLSALEALGLSVPDDVSVLGFDDLPCASLMSPRLSTLFVDRRALAHEAVDVMRHRLAEPAAPARQVQHAVRLVEGGTIAAAKATLP